VGPLARPVCHLGVGATTQGQAVTILIDADNVTVIQRETGEVLSEHHRTQPQLLAQPTQTGRANGPTNMNDDSTQI
jgi:hypothetical protein